MTTQAFKKLTTIAALAALLIALGAFLSPSQALAARTLSIKASPTTASTSGVVTFSGTVSHSGAGAAIKIQRKAGTTWLTQVSKPTAAGGAYSINVTLPSKAGSYVFRAIAPATTKLALAYSKSVTVKAVTPTPAGVSITTSSLPDAARGASYSKTLTHSGGAGTWTISGLPAGLTFNGSTGVISGITSGPPGTYGVYPVFTETSSGTQAAAALALHVTGPALAITTTSLPDGTKGVAYSTTLTKTGLAGTWSSLTLPDGLTLNATTGVLSGTPTVSGDYSIYVAYTETSTGAQDAKGYALHLVNSPIITTTSVPDGITGTAYSQQLAKTGQAGTWALKTGQLPAGVTLSSGGLLSGTPTATGDYGFTVRFTETATGYFDDQPLLLHTEAPNSPHINTTSLPAGVVGTPYSATLSAVGTGTWSVSYNVLPPGIALNPVTGALTGTPTTDADYIFIVKFTTATGSNTKALLIHVDPAAAG